MPRTTPDSPPTPRQREILRAIVRSMEKTGRPPTLRELSDGFGFKLGNAIVCHLRALRLKGFLTWEKDTARSLSVVGLKVAVEFTDDEAGRRLAAALAPAEALTPAA